MEEILREPVELTESELESVAGGFFNFDQFNTNIDSNQGNQFQLGNNNINIDSNQGNQGVVIL
jgi:hypothetical protein